LPNGGCRGGIGRRCCITFSASPSVYHARRLRAFPTELDNAIGDCCATRGEFGATTAGRGAAVGSTPPRSSAPIQINGVSGLCITKLDVLDA